MSDLSIGKYYILYVDLLGYKSAMDEKSEIGFLKIIDESYKMASELLASMSIATNLVFEYKVFSDNIVVAVKADSTHALYPLCFVSLALQRNFIDKEILCRGAITKGTLHINQEYVFGSGIIRAYELEKTVAYYPRIILDRLLETDAEFKDYDVCCQDNDGYTIIDYLRMRDSNDVLMIKSLLLAKHKRFIEAGLNDYGEVERIFQKYAWCREYHNSSCDRFDFPNMII